MLGFVAYLSLASKYGIGNYKTIIIKGVEFETAV